MSDRAGSLWAVLGGAAIAMGQVPFSLVPVALSGIGLACWLCSNAVSARQAAGSGLTVGIGYFAVALHWIVQPFLVDAATHGWMAPFALIFTATGFALFWAAAFWVARRWSGPGWRGAVGVAAALATVEAARSLILTGFPWALPAYIWADTPAAQVASVTGPFGLSLLTLLAGAALGAIGPRRIAVPVLVAAWLVPIGLGALRGPAPQAAADAPVIRIVQPNVPQDEKFDGATAAGHFDRALGITAAPGAPALIVWPETSVPYLIEPGHPVLARLSDAARGAPLAVGAQRAEGYRYFNTLVVIGPDGTIADAYDKHHLVPFGEFFPLGDFFARFGIRGLAQTSFGYSPGPGPRLLDLGPLGRPLPLICYEAIFAEEVGASPTRPDWLLQITNDAWFGTFAGPQQHLAQARFRSIEQGLPMIRSANTGISAALDAHGRIMASLPLGVAGHLDVALPPAAAATIYARLGDWPSFAAILLCFGLARVRRREPA